MLSCILAKSWYDQQKSGQCDEAEHLIKTAAKILKCAIKNHKGESNFYPKIGDIGDSSNENVPDLLKLFVSEMINSPLK